MFLIEPSLESDPGVIGACREMAVPAVEEEQEGVDMRTSFGHRHAGELSIQSQIGVLTGDLRTPNELTVAVLGQLPLEVLPGRRPPVHISKSPQGRGGSQASPSTKT
jgi:hypothetical protein